MNQTDTAANTIQSSGAEPKDDTLNFQIQHLLVATEHILRQNPAGINELGLIKTLQRKPWELIGTVNFAEPDKLYPVHFLLFHVLYRLRDQLATGGESVTISPLIIRLRRSDVVGGTGLPDQADELRRFYLDLSKYQMPEESINRMMDDFWAGRSGYRPERAETREAAAILGFESIPAEFDEVKQRFRKAVMHAHPDRGGETEAIQHLNHAFSVLKAHFRT
ncbi:DNA-J related domain-containing protein [Marinobacter sp. ATCH36]|uniref:DNA-J related domain-containing protein n=1 Tax=Marinobacter sp. ATCH36 TaxID=2945106 RepID=UPI0020229508|nr:DNA-J related domain-containing protein [Marinobacter sp. ATCH36]MCL7945832.1 molecular chaperone DnaJ [Marinobacter sp. ATCH36]